MKVDIRRDVAQYYDLEPVPFSDVTFYRERSKNFPTGLFQSH